MKNRITKILLIISLIILGLGITFWFGTNSLVNENDNVPYLFSMFGMVALKLLVICITVGLIGLIWLIYGFLVLIKRIRISQFKYKNLIIFAISLIIIIIMGIVLSSLLKNNLGVRKTKYDYAITYQDGTNIYNIYKTGNKIEVYADKENSCIKEPCPTVKSKTEIKFSDSNMIIVNNCFDSFLGYDQYNAIQIFKENLNQEQRTILDSIIYNDESLLNKENTQISGIFTIITDKKWKTMRQDGGSNDSVYYQIDLDNKVVTKVEENFYANLLGTSRTEKNVFYTKQLDDSIINETKKIIDEIINKKDVNFSDNEYFFTIENSGIKKDIYNLDTIDSINELLSKFDNYN